MTNEELLKAYRTVFSGEYGKIVLDDLMDFCWMFRCTAGMDTDVYEGRRTVILHIMERMGLNDIMRIVSSLQNVPPTMEEKRQGGVNGSTEE
jgi:hypothetical protein